MSVIVVWLLCGAFIVIVLVARHWTTVAPWAAEPDSGEERALRWVARHRTLLLVVFISGPIGLLIIAGLALLQSAIIRIGNHDGFQ